MDTNKLFSDVYLKNKQALRGRHLIIKQPFMSVSVCVCHIGIYLEIFASCPI